MPIFLNTQGIKVVHGESLEVLRRLPDNSIHSFVTDPPYGLSNTDPSHVLDALTRWVQGDREYIPDVSGGFMGKAWDSFVPPPALWDEVFRVLKPGGHLLCFAGSRTFDLMGMSIRLAGFDMRDSITWLYGSGFPKSRDIGKDMDRLAGVKRERVARVGGALNAGTANGWSGSSPDSPTAPLAGTQQVNIPITEDAQAWQGWGTALKPASEPIIVARKPLGEKTVAANVLKHGTGALNIDASRVAGENPSIGRRQGATNHLDGGRPGAAAEHTASGHVVSRTSPERFAEERSGELLGRWPANVILSHSEFCVETVSLWECVDGCPVAALDAQSGVTKSTEGSGDKSGKLAAHIYGDYAGTTKGSNAGGLGDSGGASRFFYQAKASSRERPTYTKDDGTVVNHPTVKSLALMCYLVKLVTPPDGIVGDPFAGSGTTAEACLLEGFKSISIEREADYLPLISARINRNMEN